MPSRSPSNRQRTMVSVVACAALGVLVLGGCRKGPDTDRVRRDIQQRLDRDFKKGLFKVENLARRGHYPYTESASKNNSDRERLAIYYSASLRLLQDYSARRWDQLNIGSLLSLLGAAKRGIEGVTSAGNKKGDRFTVRGLMAYAAKGDDWRLVPFIPTHKLTDGAPRADKEDLPYRKHMKEISRVASYYQANKRTGDLNQLNRALELAVASIKRREAKAKGWLSVATGSPAGEYNRQGVALTAALRRSGIEARPFATRGSIENCRLVAVGDVEFAYSQNDIARAAVDGTDPFRGFITNPFVTRGQRYEDLRAVAALYPEAVQIVVKRGSGLTSLTDLRGKRVNIGPFGSGINFNARQVLSVAIEDVKNVDLFVNRSWEALEQLKAGKLDAVFLTSTFPNDALYHFAEKTPIDLLPMSDETFAALRAKYPYLESIVLPAKTYPGMNKPCRTVHVTAMLVTRRQTSNARVETMLKHLYSNVEELSRGSVQAYLISPRTALSGISIPLHPAAASYFKKAR